MNERKTSNRFLSVALGALSTVAVALPVTSSANDLSVAAEQPTVVGSLDTGTESKKASYQSNVYIVQLEGDPVATYMGEIPGLKATSNRATGANKLDTNSKASKKYRAHLQKKQAKFVTDSNSAIGRSLNVSRDFQIVLNGVAAELSEAEADALRSMPGVKSVVRERYEVPLTDAGPGWINAPDVLSGPPNNVPHSMGTGIVIAILDSGINSDHPSFADVGGDGYDHTNPLGSGNYVPGSYCDVEDPGFCNDKLIGAWDFTGPSDGSSPEDTDGHGSHTAATAGGNVISGATLLTPTTTFSRDITGVLPHANIIAYDVCIDSCPGSALLAAIEQVVVDAANLPDGIHALNYSISGGGDPYNDPVEIGFLNATEAGVYVAASAGNNGPGASTNGHSGPWVSTTGASTHNRVIVNSVVGMDSDNGPLADIVGAGLTAGYGPEKIVNAADFPSGLTATPELCGVGDIGDNISPWPPGTFNGEIVACTRGTFGRVEKGANVLAAGAGGYILMDNGSGIVGDAHVLPGVHITQADGAALAAWLAGNATATGSINGFTLDLDDANGDIMAGFSSRGPATAVDVIKPDVTAPGVSIFAAEANGQAMMAPEYQFLSGTSMSSPHNAGAGALISAVRPDWSPHEVRSALMMTAKRDGILKEDGVTPADPFDMGAGRLNLERAQEAGVTLDETKENFLNANPETGGDPKTLNLASMQDSGCLPTCSWTRTVTNVEKHTIHFDISTAGPAGLGLSASPSRLKVKSGQSADITVNADTSLAPGWNFASLELARKGDGPDLHMPIAANGVTSTSPDVLSKTVDAATAAEGEPLNYEISIVNGQLSGPIDLEDELPDGLSYVDGSANEIIAGGSTTSPFSHAGGTLSWSGTLDVGGIDVLASPAPFGYFSLASLGVSPLGFPGNCDDGAFGLGTPAFDYNGATYGSAIMSVNGTLEVGTASGVASSFANQNLPDPATPNNILAPFWRDLNGCPGDGSQGNMYAATLNAGPFQWFVVEWEDIPFFGIPTKSTFQIWIGTNASAGGNTIHYTYARLDDATANATVGAENATGTLGDSYYYNGAGAAPAVGTDLAVVSTAGGTATFTFQAEVDSCTPGEAIVNRADVSTASSSDTAIAVTECVE